MRGLARRLRSNFSIGSSRMAIRSQRAWYWRWLLNVLMMAGVAAIVWWLVQNSYRITGLDAEDAKRRIEALTEENTRVRHDMDAMRTLLIERDRQLQVERASQGELARAVAGLQEENASLKEDLGFLRKVMSSGATAEGIGLSDLKIERDGGPNQYRYRMLLTQGGQRKQDFRGKVQILARVAQGPNMTTYTYPEPASPEAANVDFRFYQKVEGRFAVPDGGQLRSAEVRILAVPGGQVKLSRTVNVP
ncbi:MAG TPA: DUF6776 family protein [Usitatibacter sp.]|nr:DUF6776 family protein [Usitatibacter sp.]